MQKMRYYEIPLDPLGELGKRSPLVAPHQVERHERLMLQVMSGPVSLCQPLPYKPFPFVQQGVKAVIVLPDPHGKQVVLLVFGRLCPIAGPD